MTPGPWFIGAGICLVAGLVAGPRWPRLWTALTVLGAGAILGAALVVLLGAPEWDWHSNFLVGGEALHLRLDGLSAIFLALVGVVGGAGAVYAADYWSDRHYPVSAPRSRAWWCSLLLAMTGVLLSSNGLHFLIAWEWFTVSAYFLVTLDRARREVRAAGWVYLAASHVGTVCLFAFFAGLAARTGSWELGPLREQAGLAPWFWVALLGFGVKAGLFPLHVWLPAAHANAPSHVSALMSGVAIKLGVYGIVRFSGWLPVPPAAGWVVLGLGATSALLGIAFALVQNDYKRLLAYCSVENVGIIMIGLGGALLAATSGEAPWGRLVLAGALLHVWNHAAFKSLLFFGAGSVLHGTGTREMSRLGGLWQLMPWTAGVFAVGAVAVAGLPPLNGFVSEWLVYLGLFDAVAGRGPAAGAAMVAALVLGAAGALALASFVKTGTMIFLGSPRTRAAARARESGWPMRAPMLGLAGLCGLLGLAPLLFWPAVGRAVGVWHPAWTGLAAPMPLRSLGLAQVGLVLVAGAASIALWRKVRAGGLRRGLTWDCGYAAPTAHMQYSGGSFAGVAVPWFSWIMRPVLRLRRPRGPFPAGALRLQYFPDPVLRRVVGPAGVAVLQVSTTVRRLQQGRLQAYILYLAAGLAGLAVFVWLGGGAA